MSILRRDPISGRWVLIAPDFEKKLQPRKSYEPKGWHEDCSLCEGKEHLTPKEIFSIRKNGTLPDTPGWSVRVIPFHDPFLRIESPLGRRGVGIYDELGGFGAHEIVVESPLHDRLFHELELRQISNIFHVLRCRVKDLLKDKRFRTIFITKSSDYSAGALFSHPHFQIIATPIIPSHINREFNQASQHFFQKDRCIFCDILLQEKESEERVVVEDGNFLIFTPFASRFPYELIIFPKNHCADFGSIKDGEIESLSSMLKDALRRLNTLYPAVPYNLSIHSCPNIDSWQIPDSTIVNMENFFHWHISIVPRIYRHMGFEWHVGLFVNPVEPETAARKLRGAIP